MTNLQSSKSNQNSRIDPINTLAKQDIKLYSTTRSSTPSKKKDIEALNPHLREVWASNFDEELKEMMKHLRDAKYVAMDTEFPGTVYKPTDTNSTGHFD